MLAASRNKARPLGDSLFLFTKMPYPFLPEDAEERFGAMWVTLPNKFFDPRKGHGLYNRCLDEFEYADEVGLNIMLNEHHAAATCLDANVSIRAADLVRCTNRTEIAIVGYPLAHRNPIQVAEEAALLDVIFGGRVIIGFVRGVVWSYSRNRSIRKSAIWASRRRIRSP